MKFMTALAGSTIFTTYSVYYVAKLGFNPLQLMLIGTVLELTVLVFEGITGVVADTYSRRLSVTLGMFILGGGFMLEGSAVWLAGGTSLFSAFALVLGAQLLFGLGWTFISGADTAWIVDEVGEEEAGSLFMRSQRLSLAASLLGIGISVGLSTLMPNLPYLAGGAIYFAAGFYLLRCMRETNFQPRNREPQASHFRTMRNTWLEGAAVVRRSPLLITMVFVTLFGGAASEGYDRLWQVHLINGIGFPDLPLSMAAWFGLIGAAETLLGLLAVHFTERRIDMGGERKLSAVMLLLTAVRIACIAVLALSPSFGLALFSVLVIGMVSSVAEPVYASWLNRNLESRTRATVLSMVSQSDALGQTAGGPVVGWIGSRFSIRASLLAASILLLPLLVVFGRGTRKQGSAPACFAENLEQEDTRRL
ncbi:MFS transporter [Paenibacillus sophorae]|nr:MFS transporter [Paenibacillus sophorae]QWU18526.1 MFS transporter [Paenibacillus sophorae]